jgi:hypothetical protein
MSPVPYSTDVPIAHMDGEKDKQHTKQNKKYNNANELE